MKPDDIKFKNFNEETNINYTLMGVAVVAAVVVFFSLLFIYPPAFFVILILGVIIYFISKQYNRDDKIDNSKEKGSAFMTMMSLENPILLLSSKRRKLTENYLKGLTGADNGKYSKSAESPLDELNRRYVNGEIDEKEYKKMKRNIEN